MRDDEKMAAMIAVQILDRVDDGQKLFTLHRHWPINNQAISYGFYFTLGVIVALCGVAIVGSLVLAVIGSVFP